MTNAENEHLQWSNVKDLHSDRFIESTKETFNMNTNDNLHPETRRRMQMLGLLAKDEEQQEVTIKPETIDNEDPAVIADKYMMQHDLYELFKRLTTKIVFNRPSDPVAFMIGDLENQVNGKTTV